MALRVLKIYILKTIEQFLGLLDIAAEVGQDPNNTVL